jgi:sucrose-6-phosphate hydrolase SacC (GH32 family)
MFDLYYDGQFLRLNSKTVDMAYQQVAQSDFVDLRLILDASSVEMFVNSQFSVTIRSYPYQMNISTCQLRVTMTGEGLVEANVWQMLAISNDRLTTDEYPTII